MNKDQTKKLLCEYDGGEYSYKDFISSFQSVIDKTRCKGFYIEGFNLNWMNASGYIETDITEAQKLLNKVKPNTDDFSVEVYKLDKNSEKHGVDTDKCKFEMVIYHHDCPTGSRMYFYSSKIKVKPMKDN